MFDKKQKKVCVKRIHLVSDDGLYNQKGFLFLLKICFLFILYMACDNIKIHKKKSGFNSLSRKHIVVKTTPQPFSC